MSEEVPLVAHMKVPYIRPLCTGYAIFLDNPLNDTLRGTCQSTHESTHRSKFSQKISDII